MVDATIMVDATLKESSVPSPCIDICRLDARGVCIGCRRTLAEISEWSRATDERRREILSGLTDRRTVSRD
jgi:predicted Fe-S protein YdhL (DUF1289 family)